MKCLICNSNSKYYFSKTYNIFPYSEMMKDIGKVIYYRCEKCGFTISKTHQVLDNEKFEKLNYDFHHYIYLQ